MDNIIANFLDFFIKKHENDNIEIEGIILFGSALSVKYFNAHSDVDIYVVIKNSGKRYRGVQVIDGIEVDYFVNPMNQLKMDFEKSLSLDKKTVLFMLADGKIIQDKDDALIRLQQEAKNILQKKTVLSMSDFQITNAKYFIGDYLKDIEDFNENKDVFAWQRSIYLLMNYLLDTFCSYHNIYVTKPKYQKKSLMNVDPKFVKMYEDVSSVLSRDDVNNKIIELSQYVIDDIGGDLPESWEIVS